VFLLFLTLALAGAPVDLQSCRVPTAIPEMPDRAAPAQPLVAGVAVTFVNRASQVATGVTFRVAYDDRTVEITDHGKFSPGTPISAMLNAFVGMNYWRDEPDACTIVRVRFADGSVWKSAAR